MANLKTTYMGLELKNPIIAGASNLMKDLDKVKEIEQAGASALVFKSLFEEQINLESAQLDDDLNLYNERYGEMISMHPHLEHAGPKEHLMHLKKVKEAVDIPVFASLNAIFKETWVEYAQELEKVGIDGLELNFYTVPKKLEEEGVSVEEKQLNVIEAVKSAVNIPVSVKLSPFYSNPLNIIYKMDKQQVDGFVLFNRFFEPDIDVDKEEMKFPFNLSSPGDYRLGLRYAGLLHGHLNGSICSNTGIMEGNDVLRMLLAGADVVQVVSTLYKNKIGQIDKMLKEIEKWMDDRGYDTIDDFKGKLSRKHLKDPFVYQRAQYVDIIMNPQGIIKNFPV
ncbi:MAG: dihydroorotate dehydrogenase-like protein [Bacteroidales bacterium]|jgi:dihydroorotate dehydrogenase (fumarate)